MSRTIDSRDPESKSVPTSPPPLPAGIAGNWYARGSNATTNDDWLVRNGVLIDPAAIALPGNLVHPVPLPLLPQYLGFQLFVQGVRVELIGPALVLQLTNAQDVIVGL